MRAVILAVMAAGPVFAQEAETASGGLDRAECIELLALSESEQEEATDLAENMQGAVLGAHGPIAVETDPTQPLIDGTVAAWDAFGLALGDLCRDKL